MKDNNNMEDLLAYMIGPKAENMEIFRKLVLEALDDHMYWRRNFHPEDKHVISAADQNKEGYKEFTSRLRDLMFEFLSEAKEGVPFFSPRYIGHMNTDLLLPALVGYFSAMLYNQNNVAGESSPVTVKLEGEVIDMLLKMVGMDPRGEGERGHEQGGWGYLCSGGTAANIYSLWVARNLRTLPIAMRLAIENKHDVSCEDKKVQEVLRNIKFNTTNGEEETIGCMNAWELANIPTDELYRLRVRARTEIIERFGIDKKKTIEADKLIDELINPFTIQELGDHGFRSKAKELFPKEPNLFTESWRVYVSENTHYSWVKAANILGLGQNCIVKVPHLPSFDVDVEKLKGALCKDLKNKNWALVVASNFGTTEEGALDDLPEVHEMLNELQKEHGATVWWHVDAAYGGYLGSMIRRKLDDEDDEVVGVCDLKKWLSHCCTAVGITEEQSKPLIEMSESSNGSWLSWEKLIERTTGMSRADSITMDPHKLGYIPYSAGALLLRRGIAGEVVSCDAPYLWLQDGDPDSFVGRFTLEGSRPGAVAAACWLAHSAIPLDQSGHGKVLALSILSARQLYQTLRKYLVDSDGYEQVALLHQPHMNMICYVPYRKNMETLEEVKDLTIGVVKKLSPTANDREFMAVSTDVKLSTKNVSKENESPLFNEMLQSVGAKWVKMKVIRSVVMGAYSLNAKTRKDRISEVCIFDAYAAHLRHTIQKIGKQQVEKEVLNRASVHFMAMDDNPEVTEQLRSLFEELWDASIELPWKHYTTEEDALNRINDHETQLDMVFLDIDMRGSTLKRQGKADSGYTAYEAILRRNSKVNSDTYRVKSVVFFAGGYPKHDERIKQLHEQYSNNELKLHKILKNAIENPGPSTEEINDVQNTVCEIAKLNNIKNE